MTHTNYSQVLIVDDDPEIREAVAELLADEGLAPHEAEDVLGMDEVLCATPIDLVLLDLGLPGETGLEALRRLRDAGGPPVIIVSAATDPVDRVLGLELGADDYVAKPFSGRELLARVRAVLRRERRRSEPFLAVDGGWRLCGERLSVTPPDGPEAALSLRQFDVLRVLAARPGRVVTREEIRRRAGRHLSSSRSIDAFVGQLRETLGPAGRAIRTVRQRGYAFEPRFPFLSDSRTRR